jgi:hypothetical protein
MPLGGFLDTMPTWLFIVAHIIFLIVGIWAAKQAMENKLSYASAFWLYAVTQLGFLAFFAGWITLKMAVLFEQTLIVIMIIWIITKIKQPPTP